MPALVPVSIGIMIRDIGSAGAQLWMQKRSENGPLDGLWEFPGGKIEAGESPLNALVREIMEEVGLDLSGQSKIRPFKLYPYQYRDRSICLYSFIIMIDSGDNDGPKPQSGRWFELGYQEKSRELRGTIPDINHLVIDELLDYVKNHQERGLLERLWTL